jgi:hypothetical protein
MRPTMLIHDTNMRLPCAALSDTKRRQKPLDAARRLRSAASSAARSPPGTAPPSALMRACAAAAAADAMRAWWMLMSTQPMVRPPSTQTKDTSVAVGRPVLWMSSDVAVAQIMDRM